MPYRVGLEDELGGGEKAYSDDPFGRAKRAQDKAKRAPEREKGRKANRKAAADALASKKKAALTDIVSDMSESAWKAYDKGERDFLWDDDSNEYKLVHIPGKDPSFPILRAGKTRAQRLKESSTSARPEQAIAEGLFEVTGGFPAGAVGAAAAGAAKAAKAAWAVKGLTPKMGTHLKGALKAVEDIPQGLEDKAPGVARRLFGKDPSELTKDQAHIVWVAVVNDKRFKPLPPVAKTRKEVSEEATARLERNQRSVRRSENETRRAREMATDAKAAKAAGTPGVRPGKSAPAKPGSRRADRGEGGPAKGIAADAAEVESRQVDEVLRGEAAQAKPRASSPSMAGESRSPERVAGAGKKSRKNQAKRDIKKLDKDLDGLDLGDTVNARRELDALQKRLDELSERAPDNVADVQSKLDSANKRVGHGERVASDVASAKERKALDAAARQRAASQSAKPASEQDAAASWAEWLELDTDKQQRIGRQAAELSGKPWEKLGPIDRRNFIHKTMQKQKVFDATDVRDAARREERSSRLSRGRSTRGKRRRDLANEAAAAEKAAAKAAADSKAAAADAPGPASKAASFVGDSFTNVGSGITGAMARNKKKTIAGAAAAGGVVNEKLQAVWADERREDHNARQAADHAKLQATKAKTKEATEKRRKELNEGTWYSKGSVEEWPSNWETVYNTMFAELGGANNASYRKYQSLINKGEREQAVELAAKSLRKNLARWKERGVDLSVLGVTYDTKLKPSEIDIEAFRKFLSED